MSRITGVLMVVIGGVALSGCGGLAGAEDDVTFGQDLSSVPEIAPATSIVKDGDVLRPGTQGKIEVIGSTAISFDGPGLTWTSRKFEGRIHEGQSDQALGTSDAVSMSNAGIQAARPAGPDVRAGLVAGRIVSRVTGMGIPDAQLMFQVVGGATSAVRSDANGQFQFQPAMPGVYLLVAASARGFLPFAQQGYRPIAFDLSPGRRIEGVILALTPEIGADTGIVLGRVMDAQTGAPIPVFTVVIHGLRRLPGGIELSRQAVVVDSFGRFELRGLPEGLLELIVMSPGYLTSGPVQVSVSSVPTNVDISISRMPATTAPAVP